MPGVKTGIEKARRTAVELGELSHDEAEKIAAWLKRDVQDAGRHLAEDSHEIGDWLRFDIDQIEDRLLDMFTAVADRTRLDILELQHDLQQDPPYLSGEITGPGSLHCTQCNHSISFNHTARIPPCPNCGNESFRRWPVETS